MTDVKLPGVGAAYWEYFGKKLVEFAGIYDGASILDIGTGYGSSLFPAAEKVGEHGEVIGIDRDQEAVSICTDRIKKKGLLNAKMFQMDAKELQFPDNSFDFILSGFIGFDHILDFERCEFIGPKSELKEIYRVLKPGGRVSISTWKEQESTEWMRSLLSEYLNMGKNEKKMLPYGYSKENEKGCQKLLLSVGFKEITILTENYTLVFQDEEEFWNHMRRISWGWGKYLNRMNSDEIEKLKGDSFKKIQNHKHADGIYFRRIVIYAFATK